ncbi:hypothetical protein [Escherichia marmotae]|uniref:hypothetical protein n=1 Tax=Escherichia marmotae TaxID=1499973 RepID=UPI002813EC57|nr:hypothetical protein [Escherichia marmotae]MDQ9315768.1 hypothetical protein [Escherichia marmotae]
MRQASHPALVPRHWRMRREALSALHVQSCRPDKTRQASHPALVPRHWRMRRERLIRPACAILQAG